jgi:predicted enzyme related to lactoylglutathione lyase
MPKAPLLGLRTASYAVTDLARAREWYVAFTGVTPYFDQPFYVGFNIGGFELGLIPVEPGTPAGSGGTTAYWGVERIDEAWAHLLSLGATAVEHPQDVGEGIRVATALDPFGNRLGVIENPHFPNTA